MANFVSQEKLLLIIALVKCGRPLREIASLVGVNKNTVARYRGLLLKEVTND